MQVEIIIIRPNHAPVGETLTGNYKQMAAPMHRLFWRQVIEEAVAEALGPASGGEIAWHQPS